MGVKINRTSLLLKINRTSLLLKINRTSLLLGIHSERHNMEIKRGDVICQHKHHEPLKQVTNGGDIVDAAFNYD